MLSRTMIVSVCTAVGLLMLPGLAGAADAGRTGQFENGTPFPFHYLVRFWRENPPGTAPAGSPNASAPGYVSPKPGIFIHNPGISKSELALIERKLMVVNDALLALPPLKDVRGSSITTSINIRRGRFGQTEADLAIGAFGINLADPKTLVKEGRYVTPGGEAPWLKVTFNAALDVRDNEPVIIAGSYNGLRIQQRGRNYIGYVVNSARPLTVAKVNKLGQSEEFADPAFFDTSARPSQLQLLTVGGRRRSTSSLLSLERFQLSRTHILSS
jgi:hypothetical protein